MSERFRVGDELTVSCPFTESEVSQLMPGYAAVKWPWHASMLQLKSVLLNATTDGMDPLFEAAP